MRRRIAWWLRVLADRVHRDSGPLLFSSRTFTYENGVGLKLRDDGRGTALWTLDYDGRQGDLAYLEADNPPPWRLDWSTMTAHPSSVPSSQWRAE